MRVGGSSILNGNAVGNLAAPAQLSRAFPVTHFRSLGGHCCVGNGMHLVFTPQPFINASSLKNRLGHLPPLLIILLYGIGDRAATFSMVRAEAGRWPPTLEPERLGTTGIIFVARNQQNDWESLHCL